MLSEEQTEQIKKQIIEHIESTFPEDKQEEAKEKLQTMGAEELEAFLKQNKALGEGEAQQSPFRGIASGEIPSHKIDESDSAVAVLEISPISKGHVLIIPKKPIKQGKKITKTVSNFAEKVSKRIQEKLSPKEIKISAANILGEAIINLLPVYDKETLESERKKAEPEELEELEKLLGKEVRKKLIKKPRPKKIEEEKIWLPKRIP